MAGNTTKIGNKYLLRLSSSLRNYLIEYHNYPEYKYLRDYWLALKKDAFLLMESMVLSGIVGYLFLYGLNYVFPFLTRYIYLGMGVTQKILIIILLGLIIITIENIYKWIWQK